MTLARSPGATCSVALVTLLLGLVPALSQEDERFMPKGGKTLLLELTASNPGELRQIGAARHSDTEWRAFVAARTKTMTDRDINELSGYLAVNTPIPEGALDKAAGTFANAFPPDGRDLAWNQCQSCHSLFSGYLTQDRDAQGWRNMFLSPFHRGIKMTAQERETFARYSALSMPMKVEDVPAELRF